VPTGKGSQSAAGWCQEAPLTATSRRRPPAAAGVARWVAYKMRSSPLRDEPKFLKHKARDPQAAAHQLLVHVDDTSAPLLSDL
jgi:hypothetical protein